MYMGMIWYLWERERERERERKYMRISANKYAYVSIEYKNASLYTYL